MLLTVLANSPSWVVRFLRDTPPLVLLLKSIFLSAQVETSRHESLCQLATNEYSLFNHSFRIYQGGFSSDLRNESTNVHHKFSEPKLPCSHRIYTFIVEKLELANVWHFCLIEVKSFINYHNCNLGCDLIRWLFP